LDQKPTALDDVHTDANKPKVSIIKPDSITIYSPSQKINLQISNSGTFPLQKIDIFINGIYLETEQPPFSDFSFTPSDIENLQESNDLKIISYDTVYNKSETDSTFKVAQ
jgi:archaellum component FlaF (FlaF/FlaG flagellin family)